MSSDLSTIEESIKIALDAADAATDVTSEYNKVKREHKKLETQVKQIHRYTTIIFGSSMIAAIVAMIFSSVLYFRSMSDLGVMTTTNREALVIFAENVDDLKDNVNASVPLPTPIPYLQLLYSANSSSNFLVSLPKI